MRDSNSKYALRGEICDLRIHVKALSKDCDLKSARIAVLEGKNDRLAKDLQLSISQCTDLRMEIGQLIKEVDDLNDDLFDNSIYGSRQAVGVILGRIKLELFRARKLYPAIHSLHEAHSVILEEFMEFWEEVRKKPEDRDTDRAKKELIQTAAMCVRTILDVLNGEV